MRLKELRKLIIREMSTLEYIFQSEKDELGQDRLRIQRKCIHPEIGVGTGITSSSQFFNTLKFKK